ncbi:MAG: hypothetical protein SV760_02805, partial [Halobacteria archaeon]|nr:hypothetical protein [Halobacteria archaeon]
MVSDPERRKERAVMSWSGGKDSAFALNEVLNDRSTEVTELLTTFSSDSEGRLRSTVHGVR